MGLFRKSKKQTALLKEEDHLSTAIHRNNIRKIVQARTKADTLKRVLEQNNITIEIAKAIGH